ncbi:lipid-A-disaccharide synthase N-terminal domain-containing protein [Acidobacteriota bacterium]
MTLWLAVGFVAQTMFFSRFLVQWIVSERKGESVVPIAFWYLSISGGVMLLAYSLYRQDPVFILGQVCGLIVYSRNLILIFRKRRREA